MLASLVTSKTRRKLLALFFLNTGQSFFVREISRKTCEMVNAVRRELQRLESAGILSSEWSGIQKYYKANKKSPIYAELRALVLKSEGLAAALSEALGGHEIAFAFVYGSYAEGRERPESDVDLMIIGEPDRVALAKEIRKTEKRLGREINYVAYPLKEIRKKKRGGFLANVLKNKKIMVVGNDDELKRFVEGKQG